MKFVWITLAFLSGAFLPIQAGLNARFGKAIGNPVYASGISFLLGMITVGIYITVTKQPVSWQGLKTAPWFSYLAGVLGAFYVTVVILAFPRIGPALTFGLVVAGQMVIAVLMDHFGILVQQQQSISLWRIMGVILLVAGVVIIRKF